MKILVVEDERELSASICQYLGRQQFICEAAYDFHSASEKISLFDYTCVVLDISLPGGSGLHLLKELKAQKKEDGVLIISAKNSIADRVLGLNTGADDYLVKPFHLSELTARVAAIIRRKSFDGQPIIQYDVLSVNPAQKLVLVNGQIVELTRKEFDLLLYFLGNKGRVISKNAIAIHLWGDEMDMAGHYDFIYTHIKNLRKKLVAAGAPDYIKSVYGMGYKFTAA